jgi:hypothetical protein
MADIVDRLRELATVGSDIGKLPMTELRDLLNHAADVIERGRYVMANLIADQAIERGNLSRDLPAAPEDDPFSLQASEPTTPR